MQADKKKLMNLLKTARGQVDGLIRMVEEDRYCIDIAHQLMACTSILRKANREVLTSHMNHCIADALSGDNIIDKDEKLKELSQLMLTWEKI